jgi:uncharacterized protein YdcH (DUF465 family)
MKQGNRERFKELCENAEAVDDSSTLRRLTKQIDQIIEAEVAQLKKHRKKPESAARSRTQQRTDP